MTEIFVEDDFFLRKDDEEKGRVIEDRIAEVNDKMVEAIRQPGATVKVTRWHPGVVQAIVEEVKTKSSVSNKVTSGQNVGMSVKDLLAREASHKLESKRNLQITATKE